MRYSVTIDIPAGISRGEYFDEIEKASNYFGEASRGAYPVGTVVTLWGGDTGIYDTATITAESKAAVRAENDEALAVIIEKANARAAARFAARSSS